MEWWNLILMAVVGIGSIYLISKGVEILLRGTKPSNPNRANDLLLGAMCLVPGLGLGIFMFYWLLPGLSK